MATTLSQSLAMAAKGKTLQRSQLRQHGEFVHASIHERERSRPCGQNFCGPFVKAAQAMATDGETKVLVSPTPR